VYFDLHQLVRLALTSLETLTKKIGSKGWILGNLFKGPSSPMVSRPSLQVFSSIVDLLDDAISQFLQILFHRFEEK
jgi:hypothetical protein